MNRPSFAVASLAVALGVVLGACSGKASPAPNKPPPEACPATLEAARGGVMCAAESTLSCTYGATQCTCAWPEPPCHGDVSRVEPPQKLLTCPAPKVEPADGCPEVWQPKSAEGDEPACAEDGKHCTYDAERCCDRHADCRDGHWEFASSCAS